MQDFRNLRVWQRAHQATLLVYRVTAAFPRDEAFGMRSQLRRAAASVGANVAEGCGRQSDADLRRCLQIALGSACEALNHLILARDLGLLDGTNYDRIESDLAPVRRMLVRLIQRLQPAKKLSRGLSRP